MWICQWLVYYLQMELWKLCQSTCNYHLLVCCVCIRCWRSWYPSIFSCTALLIYFSLYFKWICEFYWGTEVHVNAWSYSILGLLNLCLHVLVSPRREVKRFVDLTADETCDLWLTAQKVGSQLELYHKASSLTLAIQVRSVASQ